MLYRNGNAKNCSAEQIRDEIGKKKSLMPKEETIRLFYYDRLPTTQFQGVMDLMARPSLVWSVDGDDRLAPPRLTTKSAEFRLV